MAYDVIGAAFRINDSGPYYQDHYAAGSTTRSVIVSMESHRQEFSGELSVGNCICGELDLVTTLPSSAFPRNAKITPYLLAQSSIPEVYTWQKKSEFFIYRRKIDKVTGVLTIQAYDSLFKAERYFSELSLRNQTWPAKSKEIVQWIAQKLNVTINQETLDILNSQTDERFDYPGSDQTETAYVESGQIATRDYSNGDLIFINNLTLVKAISAIATGSAIVYQGLNRNATEEDRYKDDNGSTVKDILAEIAAVYGANWIVNNAGEWQLNFVGIPTVDETFFLITEDGDRIEFPFADGTTGRVKFK